MEGETHYIKPLDTNLLMRSNLIERDIHESEGDVNELDVNK